MSSPLFDGLRTNLVPEPYPRGPSDLASVLDTPLAEFGDRTALIDGERRLTYTELDQEVGSFAERLRAAGLRPGERLLWSTSNCAEVVIAFLACMRVRGIWVGIHPKLTDAERVALTERVDPAVTVSTDLNPIARETRIPSPSMTAHRSTDPAAIAFTSGTTGQPKGVVHSQHSMLAPAVVSLETMPRSSDERLGTPLSLTVLNALLLGPISALARGSTAVIMRRSWASAIVEDVERYKITTLFLVPVLVHDIVDIVYDPTPLSSLDSVILGGSGASIDLRREFHDLVGVRPLMSYGLTEAPTGVVRESTDSPIGEPRFTALPHVELTVVDGELCISARSDGPWQQCFTGTLGYWNDPAGTAELFRGNVLHTGDRGTIDSDGSVTVLGRQVDMILRGGANIDPTAIEAAIRGYPGVEDVAVVGLADARLGQIVGAAICGTGIDVAALHRHVGEHVTAHSVPEVWEMIPELPRNSMGKIDRAAVKTMLYGRTSP